MNLRHENDMRLGANPLAASQWKRVSSGICGHVPAMRKTAFAGSGQELISSSGLPGGKKNQEELLVTTQKTNESMAK